MGLKDLVKQYSDRGGNSGGGFNDKKVPYFSLKDDGDTATVRFLIHDEADMLKYVKEIHKIDIGGYSNKVLCLKENCEVCKRDQINSLRIIVPLVNVEKNELQIWERGLADIQELMNLIEEYGPLDNRTYKIKRNGKAKSTSTTYSYFAKDKEEADLTKFKSEIPKIVGRNFRYFLELTPEQQIEAMDTGNVTWAKDGGESPSSNDSGSQSGKGKGKGKPQREDAGEEVF